MVVVDYKTGYLGFETEGIKKFEIGDDQIVKITSIKDCMI